MRKHIEQTIDQETLFEEQEYYNTIAKDHIVRQYSRQSLFYFARNILGYDLINEDNQKWCIDIQNKLIPLFNVPKVDAVKLSHITKFLRLYPRETFKSTIFTVALPIWLLLLYPDLSIVLGSKVNAQAEAFFGEIKGHYESNAKFRYYFGNWTGPVWTNSDIIVSKRTKVGIKEPSIMAVGQRTTLTGTHADMGIIDDLVTERDRDSAAEREKSNNFFRDFEDLVRRGGITLVLGTHWHFTDAYARIKKDDERAQKDIGRKFWDIKSESCWDENRKPTFRVFNKPFLEDKLLKKGSIIFAANYENRPKPAETEIFPLDKFTMFDMDDFNYSHLLIYGYNDPALGKSKSACFAPILTAACDDSGTHPILYIIDADVKRRTPSRIIDDINEKHALFHYDRFRMESVGMQDFLREKAEESTYAIAREQAKEGISEEELYRQAIKLGLPVEPDVNLKGSKESRIEALEYPINAGYIRIRSDWLVAPNDYAELIDQLVEYPIHGYKDGPDCLAGLWRMSQRLVGIAG